MSKAKIQARAEHILDRVKCDAHSDGCEFHSARIPCSVQLAAGPALEQAEGEWRDHCERLADLEMNR